MGDHPVPMASAGAQRRPRLAFCGPGRCGKDTAAIWFTENTTLRYHMSTSQAAANIVYLNLCDQYGYATSAEAFEDRHNHREEWYQIIRLHNEPDGLTLYREMIIDHDIINGIRDRIELRACQRAGIVDLSIWIDRPCCRGGPGAHTISLEDCDLVLPNFGDTTRDLFSRLRHLAHTLGGLRETGVGPRPGLDQRLNAVHRNCIPARDPRGCSGMWSDVYAQ